MAKGEERFVGRICDPCLDSGAWYISVENRENWRDAFYLRGMLESADLGEGDRVEIIIRRAEEQHGEDA